MLGSTAVVIVVPITTVIFLAVPITMVFYADSHPRWGHRRPARESSWTGAGAAASPAARLGQPRLPESGCPARNPRSDNVSGAREGDETGPDEQLASGAGIYR